MNEMTHNSYLVTKQAYSIGYTAALMRSEPYPFEEFQALDVYEEIELYLVQAASETDLTLDDLEPHLQAGFEAVR